jgi:hypothetical protein
MPKKCAGNRIHANVVAGIKFHYCHAITFSDENSFPAFPTNCAFNQVARGKLRAYATSLRAFVIKSSFAFESFASL